MTDFGYAGYRCGVGIVLLNRQGQVLVGRRIGIEDAWQMPQGGMKEGETPRQAVCRELKEELGIENAEILAESKFWFRYEVPAALIPRSWHRHWHGQAQKWFVTLFEGTDSDIRIDTTEPEFDAWRWTDVKTLVELAAPFKRQLYTDVIGEFPHIFRD